MMIPFQQPPSYRPKSRDKQKFTVTNCARCSETHGGMEFERLERPVLAEYVMTHWAPCPTTGQPILAMVTTGEEPGECIAREEV